MSAAPPVQGKCRVCGSRLRPINIKYDECELCDLIYEVDREGRSLNSTIGLLIFILISIGVGLVVMWKLGMLQ